MCPAENTVCGSPTTRVTAVVSGQRYVAHVPRHDDLVTSLLDGDVPVPYSCREADCRSCVALVVDGAVDAGENDILTDGDVEDGYVLACQTYPTSDELTLSFDE